MTLRSSWLRQAACVAAASADYDPFFPDDEDDQQALEDARSFCLRCDARLECLRYAVRTAQPHGIWGGYPQRVLRVLIEQDRRGRAISQRGHRNTVKSRCDKGHPFDRKNTHYLPDGKRRCRTCQRQAERRARARRRSA